MRPPELIIFTDLDGTLLDARSYSFAPAIDAVGRLRDLEIPLVICTSKTRAEIELWRRRIGIEHPFISENGGGIFIPSGYFGLDVPGAVMRNGYDLIEFGTAYARLREAMATLRAQGFDVRGFGDMTPSEVSELTGLPAEDSVMARVREYDEPFVFGGPAALKPYLLGAITRMGLRYTEGRLMHVLGDNDKGRALKTLAGLYGRKYGAVVTAALGDSPNDAPMLAAADYQFLVRKPEGGHDKTITDPRVVRVDGVGPVGWAEAIEGLIRELGLA